MRVGLAALKYLAIEDSGQLDPAEREMMAAAQRVFGTDHDVDKIAPLGPQEVAARLADPQIRQQVLGALIAFSLIDGEATETEARLVEAFARAMDVEERAVKNLRQVARHQTLALRIDVIRRFWAIDKLRERIHDEGLGAIVRMIQSMRGRLEDPELARKFARLRLLPEGTLGREYVKFLDARAWPLPGEKGAVSDIIVYHDMAHVLSGYGTDPGGEVEVACFSAGCRHKEPYNFVLFVLLQFHVGIRMTPGAEAERGFFDVERALIAVERGAAMNVDLTAATTGSSYGW